MFPTEPIPERIGAYKVIRRLSAAGSADVYLGRMEGPMGFQRVCALKLVADPTLGEARLAEELAREASICAELNHPAIVRMFDFFEHDRRLVLVLEHVDGADLERLVGHLAHRRQRLGDEAIWYLGLQLFGALAHAHAATDEEGASTPVIHRNMHPQNVLVAWDGQVRLAGFGLGKILGRTPDTVAGMIKGTPGYMAPEQARGERVTPRVDVYGAGVLLWSLLTERRPPMDGTRLESVSRLRRDIPREIAAALDAALEPSPDRRKITCAELEQWIGKIAKVEAGREELRDKIALLRPERVHGDAAPESVRGQPLPRVSIKGIRPSQRPPGPGPLSVPPPPSSRPALTASQRPTRGPTAAPGAQFAPESRDAWRASIPDISAIDALLDDRSADDDAPTVRPPAIAERPPPLPKRGRTLLGGLTAASLKPGGAAGPPGVPPPVPLPPPPPATRGRAVLPAPPDPGRISIRDDVVHVSQPDDIPHGEVVPLPDAKPPLGTPPPIVAEETGGALPPLTAPTRAGPATRANRARPLSAIESIGVATLTAALVVVGGIFVAERYPMKLRPAPAGGEDATTTVAAPEPPAATAAPPATVEPAAPAATPSVVEPSAELPSAAPSATPAPEPTAAPTASATAVASAGAATDADVSSANLPGGIGLLTVTSPAKSDVYVNGILAGPANTPLKVRCGKWFVRLGTSVAGSPFPSWVAPGRTVVVPCQATATTEILPAPSK
jgi:serine/threonine protein kinase